MRATGQDKNKDQGKDEGEFVGLCRMRVWMSVRTVHRSVYWSFYISGGLQVSSLVFVERKVGGSKLSVLETVCRLG